MAKNSKRFLFTTGFLTMLLLSSVCISLIPSAHATETAVQDKGTTILNNVVGLDITKYTTTTQQYPQDSYLDVIPQENVRFRLESNTSKVDMLYTFANENLRMIHVLESEGTPSMIKLAANELEMAKNFLSNYQNNTGNQFYGELRSMLENIEVDKSFCYNEWKHKT